MKKNGVNQHMGGMNVSKPQVTAKGLIPTKFARNNLAKGGVNKILGGKWAGKDKKGC